MPVHCGDAKVTCSLVMQWSNIRYITLKIIIIGLASYVSYFRYNLIKTVQSCFAISRYFKSSMLPVVYANPFITTSSNNSISPQSTWKCSCYLHLVVFTYTLHIPPNLLKYQYCKWPHSLAMHWRSFQNITSILK